ncbi:solute carrier family 22 member 8-like isoform X1 [Bradysia coprophila]|uniref:solute carrier family 22 member 8-like isoform X1 n=2 Tax=Bradysia coprophila TaxID=38358 RepID=UPI00187D8BC8|nr:solute carrier family 22 member 8-like isoform X1 [Bradysia coprophila]
MDHDQKAELPLLSNSAGNQLQAPTTDQSINYQCRPPPSPSLVVTSDNNHQVPEKRKIEKFDVDEKMEKVDIIGRITGKFGRWQLRSVFLIYLTKIPSSWFMACIIFTAPAARHGEFYCKPSENIVNQLTNQSSAHWQHIIKANKTDWISINHPNKEETADEEFAIDFCNVYADAEDHAKIYFHNHTHQHPWVRPHRNASIIPCDAFVHHTEYKSIITDYDLVCSRDILVATTQFFHLFGVLTGGLLAVNLLKIISPKRVMLFGMLAQIFCGNMTGQVSTYGLHVFFRSLSAVCCGQMYTAGQMIFSDITHGRPRTIITCLFEQFWSIGVILLPGLASFFSSWSHIYMAISMPTVLLIVALPWIPNSPRWLIEHGRIEEAKQILIESAQYNERMHLVPGNLDELLRQQSIDVKAAPPPAGWWTLWKGKGAVRNMICVHGAWMIYIVTYYGMLLNIRTFSRDHLEINTVVAALCEIAGVFIGLLLILYTEKKWLWSGIFNVLGAAVAYAVWFIPPKPSGDARVAVLMAISMVSKVAISSTLAMLTTCSTELVCEEKKKICAFSTVVWARIWLLTAPFVGATVVFGNWVPQTAMATLSIIGGFLTMGITSPRTIPKTKRNNLPTELSADVWTVNDHKTKIQM